MIRAGVLLLTLTTIQQMADSGRCADLAETPDQRVETKPPNRSRAAAHLEFPFL